ncbi:expressed unknown protein [Seminavis robusta]|nr:expressed unknown protein [Seminavis robusta]|eukprot:Sro2333_g323670.1 n/a (212) ;mRNA; f:331-966
MDAVEDGLLGGVTPSTLQCLAQSTTLEQLHLHGVILHDTCLTQLALGLGNRSTALKDLSLDLLAGGSLPLAQALGATTTLQRLHLTLTHSWTDATFLKALAQALSHSRGSLLTVKIGTCAVLDDATAAVFVEMLQHHNHVLEELQLGRYRGIWKPHLTYYLKLNRQKRGYFHANFTRLTKQRWIEEGLIPVRHDLEGIFYFLQMNPILLSE